VRVARGALLRAGDEPLPAAPFPWIVKPSREDASHGITKDSVCHDAESARARCREVIATYRQPALVEEFLPGRELNLSVLGEGDTAEVLSPAEIDYTALPAGHPPLITYEAKWDEASYIYNATPSVAAVGLGDALEAEVRATALAAYRAIGLRDYGRVDLRLDSAGRPVVLEVNPNPDISPGAGFAKAAARSGLSHDELVARIVRSAARRLAERDR
jgi:D-alanine-D-alanine ligase